MKKNKVSSRKKINSKPRLAIAQMGPDVPVEALNARFHKNGGTELLTVELSTEIWSVIQKHVPGLREKLLEASVSLVPDYSLEELEAASGDYLDDIAEVLATDVATQLKRAMQAAAAEARLRTGTTG